MKACCLYLMISDLPPTECKVASNRRTVQIWMGIKMTLCEIRFRLESRKSKRNSMEIRDKLMCPRYINPSKNLFRSQFIASAIGLTLTNLPVEVLAEPFAYVTNQNSNSVSVIDMATNIVTSTIPVGSNPRGAAVTPDGKRVYVCNGQGTVSVIDTATNSVFTSINLGPQHVPQAVVISPDGKKAYIAAITSVSVIDIATNTVIEDIALGGAHFITITPDGKRLYVSSFYSGNVSAIDTSTNSVIATISVVLTREPSGPQPYDISVSPDGKLVYVKVIVGNNGQTSLDVIDTKSNAVIAANGITSWVYTGGMAVAPNGTRIYLPRTPYSFGLTAGVSIFDSTVNSVINDISLNSYYHVGGIAITPDGKRAYVANYDNQVNKVTVIDTSTNAVSTSMDVGSMPYWVAMAPYIQSLTFSGAKLDMTLGGARNKGSFTLTSSFNLSSIKSDGINPVTEGVTLRVGSFYTFIPPGSFKALQKPKYFLFQGVIDGVNLAILIKPGVTQYAGHILDYGFTAQATGANLTGITNPVPVTLIIGNDGGTTSVNASIR